ncbi:MAG: restriction endonuclease [Gammaproteobacteria bacterium]
MAIPDYQSIMLPMLKLAADGEIHQFRQSVDILANEFGLSEDERRELLPSGKQPTFDNRVGWARTYMTKAGLLESPKRGQFRITDRGLEVLKEKPDALNVAYLEKFEDFIKFKYQRNDKTETTSQTTQNEALSDQTPEENLESSYQSLRNDLVSELLESIHNCSPAFFEKLVIDMLVRMGYGGSRKEAGQAIGRSGDEGIDGIINEDRLGLDTIYIQAKRWQNVIGRPEIQKFAGALQGQRARKGIFITTSDYTREAVDYVRNIDNRIILINGQRLAEYMIDNGVGVSTEAVYELKRIDSDYFSED